MMNNRQNGKETAKYTALYSRLSREDLEVDGDRVQKVEIYLNFVGKFDIPFVEPTPEEIKAEQRRKKHNKINRERQRRYVEKKKQEMELTKMANTKQSHDVKEFVV